MPEARDRLARSVDVAAVVGRAAQEEATTNRTPMRTIVTRARMGSRGAGGGSRLGRRSFARSAIGHGRLVFGSPSVRGENPPAGSSRRGRGSSTNSVLPSWYPRTPLRDITAIVRAIERRRAHLREIEGQQIESPMPQDQSVLSAFTSSAQLEHNISLISPRPNAGMKPRTPSVGKVPKILLSVASETAGTSDFLTPQKKLLNSIDKVEKVVMEELQKLKRTPSAKKAEREKKVRTLMSMR
ncbi:protein POLYCHOME-like [Malania oleifera]|uniref:protein POLYCHOME-like n=1 Tax=Malania oleifera TaxID=397392 RepID=UPI0025AE2C26|nr:protein POLYCHOME-like [Malania oleifera]